MEEVTQENKLEREIIEGKLEEEKAEEAKKVAKTIEALKYNRTTRRRMDKKINHNVFTKKYHSLKAREAAWEEFLGVKQYRAYNRIKKQLIKFKDGKSEEALKGVISKMLNEKAEEKIPDFKALSSKFRV